MTTAGPAVPAGTVTAAATAANRGVTRGVTGEARAALAVFAVAVLAALAGITVPATHGAHAAVDEPQYLLTAESLARDGDLDISDELAGGAWRPYAETEPPVQTQPRPDGRQLSPHDVGLPLLLALPVALGGWMAAKVALAFTAGTLAVLLLITAVRRFAVPPRVAVPGVALAFASPPLAVYGQQVYPELPAALAVTAAVAVITRPVFRLREALVAGLAVTALPWLGVKYVPVAAALAGLALWRTVQTPGSRPRARALRAWGETPARLAARTGFSGLPLTAGLTAGLVAMSAAYLIVHRLLWGGWTVYASGDHFQRSGEFGVVGFHPDYLGRGLRLVSLLADRDFGLIGWQPAALLLLPALGWLPRRRPPGTAALLLPLVAGWLTATFVALTMHGFWWPGRQLVVVLPLALLVVLVALTHLPPVVRFAALVAGTVGVVGYGWLLAEGLAGRLTWVVGFEDTSYPGHRLLRPLLPDYRGVHLWAGHLGWVMVFTVLLFAGWRTAGRFHPQRQQTQRP